MKERHKHFLAGVALGLLMGSWIGFWILWFLNKTLPAYLL